MKSAIFSTVLLAGLLQNSPASAAETQPAVAITLRKTADSAGEQVRLEELAVFQGEESLIARLKEITVGRAANPGKTRRVGMEEVRKAVQEQAGQLAGVVVRGEPITEVRALAQRVDGTALSDAAVRAIRQKLSVQEGVEASVEVVGAVEGVSIRPGDFELSPELPAQGIQPGFRNLRVRVLQENRWATDGYVGVRVRVQRTMAVAARRLENGEVLAEADVTYELRDSGPGDAARPVDVRKLIGKRTRAAIASGRLLEDRLFEKLPVIRKGDRVAVSVTRGALTIKTFAQAEGDAAEGDSLRVKLVDSGAQVVVKATGQGEAEL